MKPFIMRTLSLMFLVLFIGTNIQASSVTTEKSFDGFSMYDTDVGTVSADILTADFYVQKKEIGIDNKQSERLKSLKIPKHQFILAKKNKRTDYWNYLGTYKDGVHNQFVSDWTEKYISVNSNLIQEIGNKPYNCNYRTFLGSHLDGKHRFH